MTIRNRRRVIKSHDWQGTARLYSWKSSTQQYVLSSTVPKSQILYDVELTSDELHPVWIAKDNPRYQNLRDLAKILDLGGPFESLKLKYDFPVHGTMTGNAVGGLSYRQYHGDIAAFPQHYWGNVPPTDAQLRALSEIDDSVVRGALGTQAISRSIPTQSHASLAQFLIELIREGIPGVLSNFKVEGRVDFFRSLGSNYLNVEFGWKPFVADIRQSLEALANQDKILADLTANSGKPIKRQYHFPVVKSTTAVQRAPIGCWPNLDPNYMLQSSHIVTTMTTKETWFNGEFRYRVPDFNKGLEGLRAKARFLLGLELTPAVIWDVAPWTWLTDWFLNTGDILANVSAMSEDDLTMHYGYLMQEYSKRIEVSHTGVASRGLGTLPSTITGVLTVNHKTRMGASPYGFGTTWDGFSPRQIAILAALGVTRRSPTQHG